MKLYRLQIHNFRSARNIEMETPEMLILLGANNHGKSNVLSALEFGLSTSMKPSEEDFFSFRDVNDSALWVEMTFSDLTAQERTTFQKYIRADETIRIRKTARLQEGGVVESTYNGYVQEPDQWWLKGSATDRPSSRDQVQREAEQVPELNALLEGGGRITQQRVIEFQQRYIQANRAALTFTEAIEDGQLLGPKNIAGGILPDFFLVPAVRDLSDETKVKTTTVFGRLLQRAVKDMAERDPRFIEIRERMQTLISELNSRPQGPPEAASELARLEASLTTELDSWGVGVFIEVIPPEIEKIFELGTQLHLDDGHKTLAERKGHGLQRAVLFALLRTWARALRPRGQGEATTARQASESVFFAMEEPELFLHPHAQRQLFTSLKEIATAPNHQVFICTHSTHFVDLEHYRRIAIVSKPTSQQGTQVRQCTCDLFEGPDADDRKRRFHMAAWVNPDRGELFFAREVILTEGETEKTIFPFLAEKLGCSDPNISVIDCGGKHNLPLYIRVLNAFQIPYCVVHDQDPLPDPIPADWSPEKRTAGERLVQANATIAGLVDASFGRVEMLSPDFEGVSGIPRTHADKKGKAIAALDHFDSMRPDEVPLRLAEAMRNSYNITI